MYGGFYVIPRGQIKLISSIYLILCMNLSNLHVYNNVKKCFERHPLFITSEYEIGYSVFKRHKRPTHYFKMCIDILQLRAAARYFQQLDILTSVDSNQPVQPPVKLRNSKQCSVSSSTVIEYSSDKQRL